MWKGHRNQLEGASYENTGKFLQQYNDNNGLYPIE